jgi:hypothetical protein
MGKHWPVDNIPWGSKYHMTPDFNGVGVTKSVVFCVVFCRSLHYILSFWAIVLCALWFTVSGWPFGIIKTFLSEP